MHLRNKYLIMTLADKELQMFKKCFKYDNANELRNALINANEKKY